jgi:hypothetical protein
MGQIVLQRPSGFFYKGFGPCFSMESSCTICGKFFQIIIGEEIIEKVAYMRFEHEILCKMM